MDFKFKDKNGVLQQIKFNPTQAQQRALDSGIDANKVAQIEINKNDILTKQDTLTQTQLVAINSGIDTNKVAQIQTNKDDIQTKQDVLQSGVNIKTINNESILGSGNIIVGGSLNLTLLAQGQQSQNDNSAWQTISSNIDLTNLKTLLILISNSTFYDEINMDGLIILYKNDDGNFIAQNSCDLRFATTGTIACSYQTNIINNNIQVRISAVNINNSSLWTGHPLNYKYFIYGA